MCYKDKESFSISSKPSDCSNLRSRAKIHLERDVGLRGSENRRPGERDKVCRLISVPKLRADPRLAFQVRGRFS
jgi:hypothetical protein